MQIKKLKMNFAEAEIEFAIPLKQLEEKGFLRKKQNIKLLKRSKGNYELVLKFLEAKRNLELASGKGPKNLKEKKEKKDKKKREKKDRWPSKPSDSDSDEEKLVDCISDLKMTENANEPNNTESKPKKEKKDKKYKREWSPEKLALKEEKKALKMLKKEEKKRAKEAFKLSKKIEKKDKKLVEEQVSLSDKITKVYLDGNNMVYVLGALRSKAIHRSGFPVAEKILSAMAQEWTQSSTFANVTVIFDNTDLRIAEEKFTVTSARPAFNTSDDALIHWAKSAKETENSTVAVFTSDRGLTDELTKCGVQVLKSKSWFKIASKVLNVGNAPFENLDMWADAWIASKNFNF